ELQRRAEGEQDIERHPELDISRSGFPDDDGSCGECERADDAGPRGEVAAADEENCGHGQSAEREMEEIRQWIALEQKSQSEEHLYEEREVRVMVRWQEQNPVMLQKHLRRREVI